MCSSQKSFCLFFVLNALLMGKSNRQAAAADKHLDMCLKLNMNMTYRQQWLHFNCASVCGTYLPTPCIQQRPQLITWSNDKAMMKFGFFIAKVRSSTAGAALFSTSLCGLQQLFCLIVQHNEVEVNHCSCSQLSQMSSQISSRFCHDTTHKSNRRNGSLERGFFGSVLISAH